MENLRMDMAQLSRIHAQKEANNQTPASVSDDNPDVSKSHLAMASKLALIALATGQFLVGLDLSVMAVALPQIQAEFDTGMAQMQWAMMAYMVAGAALAVPAGALGDRTGRRRLYMIGASIFVLGSAISALAPDMGILIVGRAIQGIGSGFMGTLALAMLTSAVPHDQIAKLIGLWTAVTSGASAFGPIIGGAMVQFLGWRWMFGINVILMALVIPLVMREVPRDTPDGSLKRKVDWLGSSLLTVAMILFAGGLSMLERNKFYDPIVYLPVAAGLVVLLIMVMQQRRSVTKLTNWASIKVAPIPATLTISVLLSLVLAGAMMQQMLLVQNVLGFTPLMAGISSFGASLMLVVFSPISPKIMGRIGLGPTTCLGLATVAIGLFGLHLTTTTTGLAQIALWFAVMGIGIGVGMPAVSAGAMMAIPRDQMGTIAGFMALISSISAVLGIAVIGAISSIRVTSDWLVRGVQIPDYESLTDNVVSGAIPAILKTNGQEAATAAGLSYIVGVTTALLIASIGVAIAAVVAAFLLGSRGKAAKAAKAAKRPGEPAPQE
ncbi:MFS transporter [Actinomycetes bacterium]|nr:MFS transporter [Actinomycetes bacterium]